VRAVVLVGGFGTRLRPLTLSVPKQMLPVGHQTMLEQVVSRLGRAGVTEVVLSLGYRPDVFIDAFPDGHCAGVPLRYAQEPEPLDTAGAIAFAARSAGIDDTFLALNGDVMTDLDLVALWSRHRDAGAEATIALTPVDDPSRYGVVTTDDANRVLAFVEKPAPGTAPSNWVNAGTYVLEPSVIDRVRPGERVSIERVIFPQLVAERSLFAMKSDSYWLDAGTAETYLAANLDLLDGHRIDLTTAVSPDAVIDVTAKVSSSIIGPGVVVGPGAEISDSVVMADAVVEAGASVVRSVVGSRSTIGIGASDHSLSVVGFDQTVTASQQLDGACVPAQEDWA